MVINIVEKTKEKYLAYEKRHQQILDAAIKLFNKRGFSGTTTSRIASEAGISEPVIYKHFKNKKDLYLECFNYVASNLLAEYKEIYDENPANELEYLKAIAAKFFEFAASNPQRSWFLVHMLGDSHDDRELRTSYRAFMDLCIREVERVMNSAKENNRLKSKAEIRSLATFFISQYFSIITLKEFAKKENSAALIIDEFIQAMFKE